MAHADAPCSAVEKFAETYVHTYATFLADKTLRSGCSLGFEVTLEPQQMLGSISEMGGRRIPDLRLSDYNTALAEHASKWKLRIFIDMVLARHVKVRRNVSVFFD